MKNLDFIYNRHSVRKFIKSPGRKAVEEVISVIE